MMSAKERMENCLPLFQHSFRDAVEKQLTQEFQAAINDALNATIKTIGSCDTALWLAHFPSFICSCDGCKLVVAIRALKSSGNGGA
jgi:hypothetical protein